MTLCFSPCQTTAPASRSAPCNLFQVGYSTKFDPETGNINRGVGLPAVKSLAGELGGSVSVESQQGAGRAFFRGAAAPTCEGEKREK